MTNDWAALITAHCPLHVDWIAWEAPTLVFRGKNWSFSCTSTWRLVNVEHMIVGCEDGASEQMTELISRGRIIRCEALTSLIVGDVRLVFANGLALEVFVASAVDPWVFRLPDGPAIIPSPTDPQWYLATPDR
jgi:hypothetical protein